MSYYPLLILNSPYPLSTTLDLLFAFGLSLMLLALNSNSK